MVSAVDALKKNQFKTISEPTTTYFSASIREILNKRTRMYMLKHSVRMGKNYEHTIIIGDAETRCVIKGVSPTLMMIRAPPSFLLQIGFTLL